MFEIVIAGQMARYATLEAAKAAAEEIFQKTGIVVGIEAAKVAVKRQDVMAGAQ